MFVWTVDDVLPLTLLAILVILFITGGVLVAIDKLKEWWQERWILNNIPELRHVLRPDPKEVLAVDLGCIYYSLTDTYDDSICKFKPADFESAIPSTGEEMRKSNAYAARVRKACASIALDAELTATTYEAGFETAARMGRAERDRITMGTPTMRKVQEKLT